MFVKSALASFSVSVAVRKWHFVWRGFQDLMIRQESWEGKHWALEDSQIVVKGSESLGGFIPTLAIELKRWFFCTWNPIFFLSKGSESRKILQVMELQGCRCDHRFSIIPLCKDWLDIISRFGDNSLAAIAVFFNQRLFEDISSKHPMVV